VLVAVMSNSLRPHGLCVACLCAWDFPQILPLPSEAKQPEPTPQCSPTCSDALQKKLDIMLSDLTNATGQE